MKIIKFFGTSTTAGYSLQGYKTLYNDGVKRNDLQTIMAVINWDNNLWQFDNGDNILFDDGSTIKAI